MSTESTSLRNEYFDILKGVGILVVFLGHSAYMETLPFRFAYSFHMPLFFLVSGIFFDLEKVVTWAGLFRKILKNLLIPYLFFCGVAFALKFDVNYPCWRCDPLGEVFKILCGRGGGPIWFLVCLAMVQLSTFFLNRILSCLRLDLPRFWPILACVFMCVAQAVSWWTPRGVIERMPLMLTSVPAGLVFFLAGCGGRKLFFRLDAWLSFKLSVVLSLISFVFLVVACSLSVKAFDIANGAFSCLAIPQCAAGFVFSFAAARIVKGHSGFARFLSWVGRMSLYFFALELSVSHVVDRVSGGAIPCPLWKVPHSPIVDIERFFIILILLVCLVPVVSNVLKRLQKLV